nr:right-handed parallel beta-helix repeat-containing protein [bacterium]
MLRTCLVFVFCCVISGLSGVFADDFFVDAVNGSDETGDGSEQNPWKRLQFAFDSIEGTPENPHMIYLFPGRYDETLNGEFRVFSDSYESVCGLDRDNVFLFNLRIEHEGSVTVKDATVRFIDIEYGQNNLVSNCVFNGGISPSLYVVNSGYAQVESCTFTGTGKIKCTFEGHLFIRNCVYAGNFEPIETDSSSELVITYSYIENGWPGTGNISGGSDPGFVVPGALDFRLRAGSVCIDAGDPSDPVP